jgi:hypothetical protein
VTPRVRQIRMDGEVPLATGGPTTHPIATGPNNLARVLEVSAEAEAASVSCRERGEQGWRAGGDEAEDHAGGRSMLGGAGEGEELHRRSHGELRT